jgi:large subunit ribosomal protein L19
MNILQKFEQKQIEKLKENKIALPLFDAGDTLSVFVRIKEGERERVQRFEGVCIARRNAGLHSSFTVRRVTSGFGLERVFPIYTQILEKVEVLRRGKVRRSRIYYLRGLTGKRARIQERRRSAAPSAAVATSAS